jgi:hypothetical protein
MLDVGCWILDAGCWMLDSRCWMLDQRVLVCVLSAQKGALEPSEANHGLASGRAGLQPASCVLSLFPDLPTRALGSLQGVELHHFLGSRLHVGGEIAGAVSPLDLGVGAGLTIGAL